MELTAMSIEELEAENIRLSNLRLEIRDQQMTIQAELNRRASAVKKDDLKAQLADLTDEDKAELAAHLNQTVAVHVAEATAVVKGVK